MGVCCSRTNPCEYLRLPVSEILHRGVSAGKRVQDRAWKTVFLPPAMRTGRLSEEGGMYRAWRLGSP